MIPEFINIGSLWEVLPPGIHGATREEIKMKFVYNDRRRYLFSGFEKAIDSLSKSGCKIIFLDGSFITSKSIPNDYDVCWDPRGVKKKLLDPVFLNFDNNRKEQKKKYYGEFFPIYSIADGVNFFYNFFQIDKYTHKAKGIIKVNLEGVIT